MRDVLTDLPQTEGPCRAAPEGEVRGQAAPGRRLRKKRKDAGCKRGRYRRRDGPDGGCAGEAEPADRDSGGSGMAAAGGGEGWGAKPAPRKQPTQSGRGSGEASPQDESVKEFGQLLSRDEKSAKTSTRGRGGEARKRGRKARCDGGGVPRGGPSEDKSAVCDACGKEVRSQRALSAHRAQQHAERRHGCPTCGEAFPKRWQLRLHVYKHTGERPFSCDTCAATFTRNYCLQQHVLNVHGGSDGRPAHVCDKCGKSFRQLGSLRTHLRLHSDERPYRCEFCPLTFAQGGSLSSHRKVHTGVKPHRCEECGAAFAHAGNLRVHLRVHSGQRPYVCPDCGFGAVTSSQLKRHAWTHTGQRPAPVTCQVCRGVLSSSGKLSRHMRNVHGVETAAKRNRLPTHGAAVPAVPAVPKTSDQ